MATFYREIVKNQAKATNESLLRAILYLYNKKPQTDVQGFEKGHI